MCLKKQHFHFTPRLAFRFKGTIFKGARVTYIKLEYLMIAPDLKEESVGLKVRKYIYNHSPAWGRGGITSNLAILS